MKNKKALILDTETVPIKITKITKNYDILMEEYEKILFKKQDPNAFISAPQFNSVVAISFIIAELVDNEWKLEDQFVLTIKDNREDQLIQISHEILNSRPYDLFVHFAGLIFDIPLLQWKFLYYGFPSTPKNFYNTYRFQLQPHMCMMNALTNYGIYPLNFRTACLELGIGDPKKECNGADVSNLYINGEFDKIEKYATKDNQYNFLLLKKIWKFKPAF